MMVDFARNLMRGVDSAFQQSREAILEASKVRFRPIVMTLLAAILGTLPIALCIGAGAGARRAPGITVVGGPVISQLLTLYISPIFFVSMEWFVAWVRDRPFHSYRRRRFIG